MFPGFSKSNKEHGPEVKSVQKELQKHGLGTEEPPHAAMVQDHQEVARFSKATSFNSFY